MRGKNISYLVLGATLAASGLYGIAVSDLLNFQAGTPIKSTEVNQNFSALKSAVQALEAPIGVSRLAIGGTAADGKVLKLSGGALAWGDDLVGSGGVPSFSAGEGLALNNNVFSLLDAGVTEGKLATNSVTTSKIGDASVTAPKLAAASVSASKIQVPLNLGANLNSSVVSITNSFNNGQGLFVVVGSSPSPTGFVGTAITAKSGSGPGIFGESVNHSGVYGKTTKGNGVWGESAESTGVYGLATTGTGAWGDSTSGIGVRGRSTSGNGVYGESASNDAIVGISKSANHAGIVGSNQSGGFAAYFEAGTAVCNFKSGTTGWSCSSDKNLKENFKPINPVQILEAVAKMPITTWTMKGSKVRQLGPTAQDFKMAFKLGDTDKSINNTDAQGVALAAIQGLYLKNRKLEQQVSSLKQENQLLQVRLENLERRMFGVESMDSRRRIQEVFGNRANQH